jgi:hypothetical protein
MFISLYVLLLNVWTVIKTLIYVLLSVGGVVTEFRLEQKQEKYNIAVWGR